MNEPNHKWTVIFNRQSAKVHQHLPNDVKKRIDKVISALTENPRPFGYKKLSGHEELYRLRVGDWRIIYAIKDDELIILYCVSHENYTFPVCSLRICNP